MALRILRMKDVQQATSLSRASIYRRLEANDFPRPVSLGGKYIGWREHEIDEWISKLPQANGHLELNAA